MICSEFERGARARALLRGQEGQTAVLTLLCMITLCGFVALVASMGQLVVEKIRLQSAADLSAFSGAAVQAAGLNELARINERVRADIEYFANSDNAFENKHDGADEIDKRMKDHHTEFIKAVRGYARAARLLAGTVAARNFPAATAYQVGVQIKDLNESKEQLRFYNMKNPNHTEVKYWYWDKDRNGEHLDDAYHDPANLYHTKSTNTAFWARLQTTIRPPALPAVFFLDAPDGIVLTADSMASPYDGHTGTPGGLNLTNCRPEYRVKFSPINHPKLDLHVPGPGSVLASLYPGIVKPGQYLVFRAAPGSVKGIVTPSIDPEERFAYAH